MVKLTGEDRRLWARVTGTVTPPRVRKATRVTPGAAPPPEAPVAHPHKTATRAGTKPLTRATASPKPVTTKTPPAPRRADPEPLEPNRQRRLSKERDPIEGRIDLHGFGRFEAEDQLRAFLIGSQARDRRSVLVITGQGRMGGGVIRDSIHDWLRAPALREVVSGFAPAHQKHGGAGALYVTLRRRKTP